MGNSDPHCSGIWSQVMVQLDCMQGMIAGYIASPKGQETIRNYLASPEGKKTMDTYLSTPEGQEMARLVLSRALDGLNLPHDVKGKVLAAVEEKKRPAS
jgi:hypothetical protein